MGDLRDLDTFFSSHIISTLLWSLNTEDLLCLLLYSSLSPEQVELLSNMDNSWRAVSSRAPRSRATIQAIRRRRKARKALRPPKPSLLRRSARLQFPGVSPPSPPPLPTRRSTGRKPKPPFPLMNLPRELRDLVYSKAAESSWELFKRLLCACQQINEEARPLWMKTTVLVLGRRGMVMANSKDSQSRKMLYPSFPSDINKVEVALHDLVLDKLNSIQNLAVKLDFDQLGPWRRPPMLGQYAPRQVRVASVCGHYLHRPLDRPVGLLEPFLSPQSGSDRRNTCEITLKNFTDKNATLLSEAVEVLARLDNFTRIFVTFESPQLRKPEEFRGGLQRRFNAVKQQFEAAFGPAVWHEGTDKEGGYLAFRPVG